MVALVTPEMACPSIPLQRYTFDTTKDTMAASFDVRVKFYYHPVNEQKETKQQKQPK